MVGRLEAHKDQKSLIKAIRILKKEILMQIFFNRRWSSLPNTFKYY